MIRGVILTVLGTASLLAALFLAAVTGFQLQLSNSTIGKEKDTALRTSRYCAVLASVCTGLAWLLLLI